MKSEISIRAWIIGAIPAVCLAVSLTSCDTGAESIAAKSRSDMAIMGSSVCTEQQMQRVERETMFCKTNTGYFASDCYVNSMRRVCSRGPSQ